MHFVARLKHTFWKKGKFQSIAFIDDYINYNFFNRHEEIESITKHYGRADIIQALERKRRNLEDENTALKTELKDCQDLLKQYESLDPELLKEYNKVREELNCRLWACKIGDRSSNSSIGSVTEWIVIYRSKS